jgi:hypothetical protein
MLHREFRHAAAGARWEAHTRPWLGVRLRVGARRVPGVYTYLWTACGCGLDIPVVVAGLVNRGVQQERGKVHGSLTLQQLPVQVQLRRRQNWVECQVSHNVENRQGQSDFPAPPTGRVNNGRWTQQEPCGAPLQREIAARECEAVVKRHVYTHSRSASNTTAQASRRTQSPRRGRAPTLIMSSARAVDHGVPIGAVRMAVGGTAMSLCEAISCSASVGATAVVKCERLGACRP